MQLGSPNGLILLATLPGVVALHFIGRRLPVRRVAGLFLWGEPVRSTPRGLDLSFRPGSVLRDVAVAALVVLLACDVTLSLPSSSLGAESWLNAVFRLAACVAVVGFASAGWRVPPSRTDARPESR